jgi:hypothetical protein
MFNVAVRTPAPVGVKLTLIEQFEVADTLPTQLSVSAKSDAFGPLIVMPKMARAPVPKLVNMTVCAVLVVPIT